MELATLLSRVRNEIGDPTFAFRDVTMGDGIISWVDLSQTKINTNGFLLELTQGSSTTQLSTPADYVMDAEQGTIQLSDPVPNNAVLVASGTSWDMFSDDDLTDYARDAVNWHTYNRVIQERYRTAQGFITYRSVPIGLDNLPPVEELPLVILTTLNVFWVLANDATTDTDVQTAEGTNISRAQRYSQLMNQINALTARYEDYCAQLNVGVYQIEVMELRRISSTTGRLVPLYKPREYDDFQYPTRLLPPVLRRYEDNSGIPSQLFYGVGAP